MEQCPGCCHLFLEWKLPQNLLMTLDAADFQKSFFLVHSIANLPKVFRQTYSTYSTTSVQTDFPPPTPQNPRGAFRDLLPQTIGPGDLRHDLGDTLHSPGLRVYNKPCVCPPEQFLPRAVALRVLAASAVWWSGRWER